MKQLNYKDLVKGDLFTVIAAKGSVFERNGDRSYKDGIFEFIESKELTPKSSLIFAKFLKYEANDKGEIELVPYKLFISSNEERIADFLSDEWDLFEHKGQATA